MPPPGGLMLGGGTLLSGEAAEADAPAEERGIGSTTLEDGIMAVGDDVNKTLHDMTVGELVITVKDYSQQAVNYLPTLGLALSVFIIGWLVIGCCTTAIRMRLENMRVITIAHDEDEHEEGEPQENDNSEKVEKEEDAGNAKALLHRGVTRIGVSIPTRSPITKKKLDPTLIRFGTSVLSNGLKLLLVFTVASMLGIQTASFVAVFTACSLAIGLALQGLLTDLAKGVLLMVFRPYKVGDIVDIDGNIGYVHEVAIFQTILKSAENNTYILPNGSVQVIKNINGDGKIRLDVAFKISHDQDLRVVKELLLGLLKEDRRVIKAGMPEPPQVLCTDVNVEGVDVVARAWVPGDQYYDWPPSFRETAYVEMHKAGIVLARLWEVDLAARGSTRLRTPSSHGVGGSSW